MNKIGNIFTYSPPLPPLFKGGRTTTCAFFLPPLKRGGREGKNLCILDVVSILSLLQRFGKICVCCALTCIVNAAEPPPAPQIEIYNLARLLSKAERIVVAEVGASSAELCTLNVQQVLKEPKPDPKQVDPEVLKRAAALLENEKL